MDNTDRADAGTGFYVRQSSGLVREIGGWTNVVLIIAFSSPGVAALIITDVPSTFPGVSLLVPAIGAPLLAVAPVLLYAWLTSAMPRSGGDYVFISRVMHPSIGFAASFMLALSQAIVSGAFVALVAPFGLAPALATIGAAADSEGLVNASIALFEQGWTFWIGAGVVVAAGILVSFGHRVWTRLVWIVTIVVMVGAVVAVIVTALNDRSDFEAAISSYGVTYDGVITTAADAGYDPNIDPSLKDMFLALAAGFLTFAFIPITTYAGGEIRSPKRSLQRSMLWSLAILAAVVFLMFTFAERTFGREFLGAATFLELEAFDSYPFPAPSFYFFYVSTLTDSLALNVLLGASYALAFTVWIPVTFLALSRQLFAWAFDRILPDRLADVNERTHAPIIANVVVVIGLLVGVWFSVFQAESIEGFVFAAEVGAAITFAVAAITGIVLYRRRRELFEALPPVAKRRVAGIPLMTIVGALALFTYVAYAWALITTSGESGSTIIALLATFIVVPFVVYGISFAVNKRRSVDLSTAFADLPPE